MPAQLTAVELLEQFETYEHNYRGNYDWDAFKRSYKNHALELQELTTAGSARKLAQWRAAFRLTNEQWSEEMGEVERTQFKRVIDGRRSTYSKLVDTPINNLRWFVTTATQKCDALVMAMETQRRNQERVVPAASKKALGNAPADALLAMRACLDARESLF